MEFKDFFIHDLQTFNTINKDLENIFNSNENLPMQVFNKEFKHYLFEEFYLLTSDDFWNTIQYLTNIFNEKEIIFAVLDPNPVEYFYKEFGYFNYLKLPTSLSKKDYINILEYGPKDYPADAPLYNSEKIVLFSSSRQWAIWGERSLDVCVMGFENSTFLNHLLTSPNHWSYLNKSVEELISLNFRNMVLPKEFKDDLSKNYSNNKSV